MDHRHGSATGPCACADIPDHMACEAKRRRPSRWGEALARAPGLRPAQRDVGRRRPRASAGRRRFAPTERARFAPGPDDLCPCCSAEATGILDTTNRAHFEPKSGHRPKRVIRVSPVARTAVANASVANQLADPRVGPNPGVGRDVRGSVLVSPCSPGVSTGCSVRAAPRPGIGNGAESAARSNRTRKCRCGGATDNGYGDNAAFRARPRRFGHQSGGRLRRTRQECRYAEGMGDGGASA